MEDNKIIPRIENCGTHSPYSFSYNYSCECKTCLTKILKRSVKNGSIDSVASLINKYKFELEILNENLPDALYSRKNSKDIIELLLIAGADPNFIDSSSIFEKISILNKAIKKGYIEIIECLLRYNANPNLRNPDGDNKSCLYTACNYQNDTLKSMDIDRDTLVNTIIELLISYGLNVDESGINIEDAIKSLNINLISHMLNRDYYLNNSHCENPFHFIAGHGVSIQRQNGTDVILISVHNTQIFNMICESQYGDTFDKPDKYGITPLHIAATSGNIPIVKCLLERGANPNSIDKYGSSIFASCSQIKGQAEIKKLLLCYGANINDAIYVNTLPEVVKDFSALAAINCLQEITVYHLLDCSTLIDLVELNRINSNKKEQPVLFDGIFWCRNYEPFFGEDELPMLRDTNGPPTPEQIERGRYINKMLKFVRNHYRKIDYPDEPIDGDEGEDEGDDDDNEDNWDNYDFDALVAGNHNNAQPFDFDALVAGNPNNVQPFDFDNLDE
jgi:ankyrin repeat protein